MPFLLFFTALCIGATFFIADVPPLVGAASCSSSPTSPTRPRSSTTTRRSRSVSYPATRGKLSGLGTGIGYCGTVFVGLLIFFLDVPVDDRFRLTALLFRVFAIPIFLFVREPRVAGQPRPSPAAEIRDSFGQLRRSIAHAREVPGLGRFLVGRFFYSDAVNTVIVVMSIVTTRGRSGCPRPDAVLVLLLLTLVAIAMSFVWGWLCRPASARSGRSSAVLISWAVGLRPRRRRDRVRARRARPVPRRRARSSGAASAASRSPTGC